MSPTLDGTSIGHPNKMIPGDACGRHAVWPRSDSLGVTKMTSFLRMGASGGSSKHGGLLKTSVSHNYIKYF